jgi:exopolysaccharide biosynthesis polyprenyl glycosylphosphotransferase
LVTVAESSRSDARRDPASRIADAGMARDRGAWQRRYRLVLVAVDLLVILGSTLIALAARFGDTSQVVSGSVFGRLSYVGLSFLFVPAWMLALVCARAYEMRFLGVGEDEYKRVAWASWWLMALIAVVAYTFKIQFARGYVAIALPVGTVLLLLVRYFERKWLHGRRSRGYFQHRVIAVGGRAAIEELSAELLEEPYLGLQLVGVCLPKPGRTTSVSDLPVFGDLSSLQAAIVRSGADTVAVTAGPGMTPEVLRDLSWALEDSGVDFVVAPGLLDVAGPRIVARPVTGLPFLHVERPELTGAHQVLKTSVEWLFATVAFVLTSPFLLLLAAAVRLDSPGSPVFRQTRVGRGGHEFTVFKLRTMHADAEERLGALHQHNDAADGLLFKMRDDPRVTRVGRFLRRWSIDEVPQLWNVVRGDMALVGPRPPLPGEVSRYDRMVARRLLVKPGITGLWQVSGRSDLSWHDSVRLDLYYVENWSLALDALIVWKTVFAVFRRHGAY